MVIPNCILIGGITRMFVSSDFTYADCLFTVLDTKIVVVSSDLF